MYGFASEFIEKHLWWLKRLIFEWQSLSHLSHLKIVLDSATGPMAFLIFLFSTCHMFHVFSTYLIPSLTRCCYVEQSLTISSQLSMSMAADFISLLQSSLKWRSGQPVLRVPFLSLPKEVLWNPSFSILHVWPSHLRRLWLSRACMLEHLAFSSTVVFGILSC